MFKALEKRQASLRREASAIKAEDAEILKLLSSIRRPSEFLRIIPPHRPFEEAFQDASRLILKEPEGGPMTNHRISSTTAKNK